MLFVFQSLLRLVSVKIQLHCRNAHKFACFYFCQHLLQQRDVVRLFGHGLMRSDAASLAQEVGREVIGKFIRQALQAHLPASLLPAGCMVAFALQLVRLPMPVCIQELTDLLLRTVERALELVVQTPAAQAAGEVHLSLKFRAAYLCPDEVFPDVLHQKTHGMAQQRVVVRLAGEDFGEGFGFAQL